MESVPASSRESKFSRLITSPIDNGISFNEVLRQMDIKTQVENVIYRLNTQYSELKTILEAHTGFIQSLKKHNETYQISQVSYNSAKELALIHEFDDLKNSIKDIVDIIELCEKFDRFNDIAEQILSSEDMGELYESRLDDLRKRSIEWCHDVHISGPAICEELLNVSIAVRESKAQYNIDIEFVERSLMNNMIDILVSSFQERRVDILIKHRVMLEDEHAAAYSKQEEYCQEWVEKQKEGDDKCEELTMELTALSLQRKRIPKEHEYDIEEKRRELKWQKKKIAELIKKRNTVKYTRDIALKNAIRKEEEMRCERSQLCVDVALIKASLCRSLKKAHIAGVNIDDFVHDHPFACSDNILT